MEGNNYTQEALARLPREELRRMLAEELHKDTQQIDDAFVRLLLTELHARGSNRDFIDDEAVEAACAKFRLDAEKAQNPRKHWYQSWMVTAASVVLMLGILFFALPAAAQAKDIQGMLTWWSDTAFRFFNPGKQISPHDYVYETAHPGLQQIYDTVTELGVTEPIVPRWIPNGFDLTELKTYQFAEDSSIDCNLKSSEKSILFLFVIHAKEMPFQHEKDENLVNIWDLAGHEHYVLTNKDEYIVTWIADGIECTIITDCPEEDVYKMIKSIYTSEG